jgi:hypothetical protein
MSLPFLNSRAGTDQRDEVTPPARAHSSVGWNDRDDLVIG